MTKLKKARIDRGWSQQVLGFHSSVAASDVSRIESGRLVPYPGQAERLANLVGLRPEELQQPIEEAEVR
jgi:ribosome-binding protein aMBF1 (putative translation factor)